MRYWIIALPREDMDHCLKIGAYGMNRKSPLNKVEKGDGIVCYVTKDRKIVATGMVSEGYYMDDAKIFKKDGVFPDRIKFKAEKFQADHEFDFVSIIDQLELITNLAYWSVYLRNGFVEISKQDWDLVKGKTDHLLRV